MVGRDLEEQFPQRTARQGNTILEVRHFSSRQKFKDINFSVRSGEILGVAGLIKVTFIKKGVRNASQNMVKI